MDRGGVCVVCPLAAGSLSEASAELIGKARELAGASGRRVAALVGDAMPRPQEAAHCGADDIIVVQAPREALEDDCATGDIIAHILRETEPGIVLFPADVRHRCVAPWVAAKLGTGLTADCTDVSINSDGLLLQKRPAYGGNLIAEILCGISRPQMATVRPKMFPLPTPDPGRVGTVVRVSPPAAPPRVRLLSASLPSGGTKLEEAEVVVAGGKGIGGRAGFLKLQRLAGLANGAAGASRSAVDAGYAPYPCQIGLTGVSVRPKVYLAFGISGSAQHVAGMSGSAYVIAVNRDRQADIFSYADLGIVADWESVCDAMIAKLERST